MNGVKIGQTNKTGKMTNIDAWKLIWRLATYKPVYFFTDCVFCTLYTAIPIYYGYITKLLFDFFDGRSVTELGLWELICIFTFVSLLEMVLLYITGLADIRYRFKYITNLLRENILCELVKRPGANPLRCTTGELANILKEDVASIELQISCLCDAAGFILRAILTLYILLKIDLRLTLLVMVPFWAVIAVTQLAGKKIENYRAASRTATADLTGTISELFGNVQAIQLSGADDYVVSHIDELNGKRQQHMLNDTNFNNVLYSIYHCLEGLGTGIFLVLAIYTIKADGFSVVNLTLFITYLGSLSGIADFFGNYTELYRKMKQAYNRISYILDDIHPLVFVKKKSLFLKPAVPDCNTDPLSEDDKLKTLILENLSYFYNNSSAGIENISFKLEKGSLTVITGRVGSGKTTLLKVLLGLLPLQQGNIYWNDNLVKSPDSFFIPPYTAYTPQIPNLFSDTIKNNIHLGLSDIYANTEEAIYNSVMEKDMDQYSKKMDTVIGPEGIKLSGGQKQRIAIARAYIREARLMVFDDASSALDINTEIILWNRILKHKETTFLVVSNRRWLLRRADNIIVLKNGRIEAEGNLEELLENCHEMKLIWGTDIDKQHSNDTNGGTIYVTSTTDFR